ALPARHHLAAPGPVTQRPAGGGGRAHAQHAAHQGPDHEGRHRRGERGDQGFRREGRAELRPGAAQPVQGRHDHARGSDGARRLALQPRGPRQLRRLTSRRRRLDAPCRVPCARCALLPRCRRGFYGWIADATSLKWCATGRAARRAIEVAEGIADEAVAVVLAGGQGTRLGGLTLKRCKPALPFGAHCRSIDFTLSNGLHSGLANVGVAAQYKADSLVPHLERHWRQGNPFEGRPVEIWEADARRGGPYAGTADAVYKNLRAIERLKAKFVLVLAADHVYRMDYAELLDFHRRQGADLTVACHPVVPEEAHHFGIMSVADDEIVAFHEKPVDVDVGPAPLASM